MTARKILRRYPITRGLLVINHRQTRHDWYVVRSDRSGRMRRVILPPFHALGSAILAAHLLDERPP